MPLPGGANAGIPVKPYEPQSGPFRRPEKPRYFETAAWTTCMQYRYPYSGGDAGLEHATLVSRRVRRFDVTLKF
jgi:hypothetical protein